MNSEQGKGGPDDEVLAEPFDQTNDVVGGLDGESDGTAASDTSSEADRDDDVEPGISDTDDVAGQGAMDAGYIIGRQQ